MDYLGIVSYGIYLWHKAFIYVAHNVFDWPELTGNFWVILAFSTFGSIAAAGLSHRLVEDPLTKMGKRFLQRSP
jgi:peptidoglycan/LPS O-acetylase OafA/YrhL